VARLDARPRRRNHRGRWRAVTDDTIKIGKLRRITEEQLADIIASLDDHAA
jgi:hypothetical protein